jgi:hypothetical protein
MSAENTQHSSQNQQRAAEFRREHQPKEGQAPPQACGHVDHHPVLGISTPAPNHPQHQRHQRRIAKPAGSGAQAAERGPFPGAEHDDHGPDDETHFRRQHEQHGEQAEREDDRGDDPLLKHWRRL